MKRVMQRLAERTAQFSSSPLFDFLGEQNVEPSQRLAFAPSVAHFVMSFADIYAYVLPEEPPKDRYQALVNAHTKEDENHWRWFLDDLQKLGYDRTLTFGDAIRFIWDDATVNTRMLSYEMCRLGLHATSLEKLVLVHCIEAAGKVTVEGVSAVGTAFATQGGKRLVYMGNHHLATESEHTIEDLTVHDEIASIVVDDAVVPRLLEVVDTSFAAFRAFADDMLATAKARRTLPAPG